jgi:hypothetical protein
MSANIAGNHFLKAISILSPHCSENLQVIQNKTLSQIFSITKKHEK